MFDLISNLFKTNRKVKEKIITFSLSNASKSGYILKQLHNSIQSFEITYKSVAISLIFIISFQISRRMSMTTAEIKNKIDFSDFKQGDHVNVQPGKLNPFASKIYSLEKPSETIVFFKQKYEKLFYDDELRFPSISSVEVIFTNSKAGDSDQIKFQVNVIQKKGIYSCWLAVTATRQEKKDIKQSKKLNEIIIPYSTGQEKESKDDATFEAKKLLQKKFWMKVSASLNTASAHINDLVESVQEDSVSINLDLPFHGNWQNQENVFLLTDKKGQNKKKEISVLEQLDRYQIIFYFKERITEREEEKGKEEKGKEEKEEERKEEERKKREEEARRILRDYFEITVLEIGKVSNSVLETQNLSLLRSEANIEALSKEIQILYEYLRKFQINILPAIKDRKDNFDSQSYYGWRNLRNGIHKSITTVPGYLEYTIKGKTFRQPVGILNVLMQLKTIDYEKPSLDDIIKWHQFKWDPSNFQKNLTEIYQKRQIYVRFQFNEPYGDAPGGMAVLEIWPPYCCSPIHNHGEAYGLIKVLANQICVQNFKDLNFVNEDHVPYQQKIYQEGQYTWLSEFSFGIHRLINTTNQTTLSLQTYQGHKGSKQYFEFIFYGSNKKDRIVFKQSKSEIKEEGKKEKIEDSQRSIQNLVNLRQEKNEDEDERKYCQYYPQHDWKNFLNWKAPQGHQKEFQYLQDYVEQVKIFYGDYLQEQSSDSLAQKLNTFQDFAMIMKREYEIFDRLLAEKSEYYQKMGINFIPLDSLSKSKGGKKEEK